MTDSSRQEIGHESMLQLLRYGLVGVASNLAGYLVYLLLTQFVLEPKVAMTLLYMTGAGIGYVGNRQWSFRYEGGWMASGFRYVIAHAIGYLINLALLVVCVDRMGFPHQLVQAIGVFVVAAYLFVAFRWFVFPQHNLKKGVQS